jgi:hypothetical protein
LPGRLLVAFALRVRLVGLTVAMAVILGFTATHCGASCEKMNP